jgi:hypothetical protein
MQASTMSIQGVQGMMSWRGWVAGLVTVLLAGCGGGGDSGNGFVGTTPTGATSLDLVLSASTIKNTDTAGVKATVRALDANRNTVANVPVTIKVDNATVSAPETKTGTDGTLVGTIGVGSDKSLRTITVTAQSGSLPPATAKLEVVDGSSGDATASDLTLTLSSPTLINSGTQTVTATVIAVDANRNTIPNIPVTMSVDSNATIKVTSAVTDADGKVTGAVGIGDDKANRVIKVTAKSGTLSRTLALQVTGAQIKSTLLPPAVIVSTAGKVQYKLTDVNGNPIPGKSITIQGPGAVQATGTSDANGNYEYSYTAPNVAGDAIVRASALGVENQAALLVLPGDQGIEEVKTTVQSASVSSNPSVVPINTTNTTNQATIRALFLAASNAPIKNVRVRFDLDGDKQSIGGTFTAGSTIVYSDASGVATTAYVPGSRFSPTDGVTVRACWGYVDFPANACPNSVKTTLTVISESLSVTIGTNNLISSDTSTLKYVNRYVVQVVDSSGLAAADVQVSASVDLLQYRKGFWELHPDTWVQVVRATCDNEDVNRNGVSEVFSNNQAEDANKSLNSPSGRPALDPRKADVALSFEGSSKTNTNGIVVLRIEYPQNVGSWDIANIVVAASGVAGTEGRANFVTVLPVPSEVVRKTDATPPFVDSPYGLETSPTIQVSEPGNSRPPAVLCTNKD